MNNEPEWYSYTNPKIKISILKEKVKKVFVLEDDENERIPWFKKTFSFVDYLMITKSIKVGLAEIHNEKFDLIFLDHDLETDEQATTLGYDIRKTINRETECIVHSMNPTGAGNLVKSHPFNIVHVPYFMLQKNLEIV